MMNDGRMWTPSEDKEFEKEKLLKTGKQVEVQGNWENLTLNVGAIQDSVQSVHFEVERKALPLIIPAKPIQELFELEAEELFRKHWQIACHTSDIPKKGSTKFSYSFFIISAIIG